MPLALNKTHTKIFDEWKFYFSPEIKCVNLLPFETQIFVQF